MYNYKKQEKYSLSIFALKSHSENNSSRNIVDKNKWRYYPLNRVEKKLEGIVGIRKCKIENGKIQIGDDISIGTVGNKIGEVVQTLKYDKKNNQFIYDKIKYKSTN
ncbi:MAG: hypothetical protein MSH21_07540 [Clostridium sp.]|nr:hypothetical protein [Clostridium sp.]